MPHIKHTPRGPALKMAICCWFTAKYSGCPKSAIYCNSQLSLFY